MQRLRQDISLMDSVAISLSASVGVSVFSILAPTVRIAGPGVMVSLTLAAIPMFIFGLVYAFLSSAVPVSGACYVWPAKFVHPYVGFLVTWLRITSSAGSLHLLAVVFVGYLSKLVTVSALPTMFLLLTSVFLLNLAGVFLLGRAVTILVVIKLAVLFMFVLLGLGQIMASHFIPVLPGGAWGVLAVLPMMASLFGGIESAAEAGEEVRDARTTISRGIAISVVLALAVYFGVAVVTIGTLGSSATAASSAPLFDAGARFLGSFTAPLLLIVALASILAALNTAFLVFSRFLFAMGRSRALPAAFGKVHAERGTPYVAVICAYACGIGSLLLPSSLAFLFLAVSLPSLLKYGANCLAAYRMVSRHPEIHAQAALRLSRPVVRVVSLFGIVCAVAMAASGIEADWKPYAILLTWAAVGTVYWRLRKRVPAGAFDLSLESY
jgi:basic amino acid/polyamine antiporter, APA family